MAVPPLPYGQIVGAVGKVGAWLWTARVEHGETDSIVREALRTSICPYDPYTDGVDEIAERVEAAMWDMAKSAEDAGRRGLRERAKAHVPRIGHSMGRNALDFPHWQRELRSWVEGALERAPIESAVGCRSFDANPAVLAERFPAMFRLELGRADRMTGFRVDLLQRLEDASDLRSRLAGQVPMFSAGAGAIVLGAAGLGFAEIANWADPGIVALASGSVGALVAGVVSRRQMLSEAQQMVRNLVLFWIVNYLSLLTGAPVDEPPQLMLREAIERESKRRNAVAAQEQDAVNFVDSHRLAELQGQLRCHLISKAEAAGEENLLTEMKKLDAALQMSGAGGETTETILPAVHRLMVALEIAPPGSTAID
jgi:hypothetical protein